MHVSVTENEALRLDGKNAFPFGVEIFRNYKPPISIKIERAPGHEADVFTLFIK